MKKINLWFFASLFVAAFTLTACGDDDNDTTTPPSASLAGTVWYENNSSEPDRNFYVTWEFDKNGNALWGNLMKNDNGKWEKWVRHSFKYTVNGDQFTRISEEGQSITGTCVIEGNTMKIILGQSEIRMTRMTGDLLNTYNTLTDDNNDSDDETLEVTEENLKGIWDATIEHDMAQGYYQRRRLSFDGNNYTSWYTHQMVGTTNDEVQGVKTVGNKEQGTWEYKDGKLILTPSKQWASYYLTAKSMSDPYYYVYLNYDPETMESTEWYETPEAVLKDGIERDLEDGINGNEFYISVWSVVSLTKTELSLKINMDTFKLTKQ